MSVSQPASAKKPLLSDRNYTILKHAAAIGLPAAGALYFTFAQIWHLPHAEDVTGSIAAVNVFLGAFMGVSQASYNGSDAKYAGAIEITNDGTKKVYSLNLNTVPEDLDKMTDATFKVNTPS
jgi:hypothetical protein